MKREDRQRKHSDEQRYVTEGLSLTLDFRELSKLSSALGKVGCFISTHCLSLVTSTVTMTNRITRLEDAIRPSCTVSAPQVEANSRAAGPPAWSPLQRMKRGSKLGKGL